jgi:hypothetical protein
MDYWHSDNKRIWRGPVGFTASLDAAMSLVPETETWELMRLRTERSPFRSFGHGKMFRAEVGLCVSVSDFPALALTCAALRAQASITREAGR